MDLIDLTRLPKTIRNLQRFRQILGVIARYGFEDIVSRLDLDSHFAWARRKLRRKVLDRDPETLTLGYTTEQRIRLAFEELGPTFIKLGQILATRPDLIPMSLVMELRKLQDDVPPFPSEAAIAAVERELGGRIGELYAEFEAKPLAAASIGQVHVARMHSGEKVVVKVQRPNLETIIANDLDILRVLARMIETRIPESRQYDPVGIVEEFARSIRKEIDFRRELHNIERFAKNFEGKAFVYTPKAFRSHSSAHVLTMEFIEGIPAYDFEAMDRAGLDRKLLAERGTQAILQQIFVDGFFHADPHPGNIFALPGNVVCFIDYGMMGTVDDERVDELLVFLVSILTNDLDKMVNLFYRLELINEDVNVRAMKGEIKDIITRYYNQPLKDIDIAVFIQEIFEVIQRYHVIIPSDLLLMSKAIATIEGIAQELYPDYDPITQMRDFLLKIYIRRLADPQYLARGMSRNIEEVLYLLKRLPKDLGSIIGKLRKGELTLTIREEAWAQRALLENRRTNRIVVAMLILAINIGAPILLTRPSGPVLFGLKLSVLVGVVGLTLSILLTVLLLLAVWRSDLF